MQYIKGVLPSWLAGTESNAQNATSAQNATPPTTKKVAPRRRGSINGAGSGSSGQTASYQEPISQAAIKEFMNSANYRTNESYQRPIAYNNTQNAKLTETCNTLLKKYYLLDDEGKFDSNKYNIYVESHRLQKEAGMNPVIPSDTMRNIGTCVNWLIYGVHPIKQNEAQAHEASMVRGLTAMYHAREQGKKTAEMKRTQEVLKRMGRVIGGKRKNKTKRSQKTKRQTRRR